jgi:hypothetical protein
MKLKADIRCYMCGRTSGTLEWDPTNPGAAATLRARVPGHHTNSSKLDRIRCPFCNGQTYLDEIEEVRIPKPVELFPARRGRPRKNPTERIPA